LGRLMVVAKRNLEWVHGPSTIKVRGETNVKGKV